MDKHSSQKQLNILKTENENSTQVYGTYLNIEHRLESTIKFQMQETNPESCANSLDNIYEVKPNRVKNLMKNFSDIPTNSSGQRELIHGYVQNNKSKENATFSNKIDHFNSLENKNDEKIIQNCKPSEIKDFHKEKLEKILKSKLNDQLIKKINPQNSFLSFEFKKNSKTGEYESLEYQNLAKSHNFSVPSIQGNRVKEMISKFESYKDSGK